MTYSYRKTPFFAILALTLAAILPAMAQPSRRDQPVLRGTAVLEGHDRNWRLIPICIYSAGKFYDADFYQSSPAPMSLIEGTIYEVQKSGTPVGNVTVTMAERYGSVWYGVGGMDDSSKKSASSVSAPGTSSDDDRPVLRRSTPPPAESAPTAAPSKEQAQQAENDPNRPTLKHGAQPAPAYGPPKEEPKEAKRELRVAISDPAQPQGHPFEYKWDAATRDKITASLKDMADAELQKQARSRGLTLKPKEKLTYADFQVRAFDVDYSNTPQVVATAKFVPSDRQLASLPKDAQARLKFNGLIVTLVARVNYDNLLERIYAEVSDPRFLDEYPVMELVDAVDVDADNRAELLFAVHTDSARRFVVYRLYGLSMNEVFTSAAR